MERAQRHSRKREAIIDTIRGTTKHPSAEWVYGKLKPDFPELSLGTVYRNIAWFQERGDIVRVATVGGQERYDANTKSHAHFICRECGDIIDADVSVDSMLKRNAEEATGAYVSEIWLLFGGLCAKCRAPAAENGAHTVST